MPHVSPTGRTLSPTGREPVPAARVTDPALAQNNEVVQALSEIRDGKSASALSRRQFLLLGATACGAAAAGTSAYIGAAPKVQSKAIPTASARILADGAYHMGNVRLMIAQKGVRVPRLDAIDILPPPAGRRYFAADDFGLTPPRTMDQVKAIARPFFPNGTNVATG